MNAWRVPPHPAIVLLAVAGLSSAGPAVGQASGGQVRETEPVVIGERFTIHSEILGEERTLLVATPGSYDLVPDARYPVLVLLDGDAHFHHATGVVDFLTANNRMPPTIVVAVPNPSQDARTRDLTPEHRAEITYFGARADSVFPTAGGADTFLRFLRDELAPLIDREYRTTPFRVLVGHSFGGLFNIHALVTDPDAFQGHIAISPSLWWDERRMVQETDAFFDALAEGAAEVAGEAGPSKAMDGAEVSADGPPTFLYMTMGNEGGAMLRGAWGVSGVLEEKAPSSFEWKFTLMEEEDHGSVPHRSLYDGLEWLYRDWALSLTEVLAWTDEEVLERIDDHYGSISGRYGYEVSTPAEFLNRVGYALLSSDRAPVAVSIFETNAERHPETAYIHDSLGDGYDAVGRLERALAMYREAVRLGELVGDPELPLYRANVERMLEKIGEP